MINPHRRGEKRIRNKNETCKNRSDINESLNLNIRMLHWLNHYCLLTHVVVFASIYTLLRTTWCDTRYVAGLIVWTDVSEKATRGFKLGPPLGSDECYNGCGRGDDYCCYGCSGCGWGKKKNVKIKISKLFVCIDTRYVPPGMVPKPPPSPTWLLPCETDHSVKCW